MNIFVPFSTYASPSRFALVRIAFTSDPASGSVTATAVIISPEMIFFMYFSFWEDEEISDMIKQFTRNTDEASRAVEWPEIQQALLDQTPVINVINTPFVNAHESNVCGTEVNILGVDRLEWTWLASGTQS